MIMLQDRSMQEAQALLENMSACAQRGILQPQRVMDEIREIFSDLYILKHTLLEGIHEHSASRLPSHEAIKSALAANHAHI